MNKEDMQMLSQQLSIDKKLIEILVSRGYDTQDKIYDFLYPSLDKLTDVHCYNGFDAVIARIKRAVDEGESILLYGDYDCDGVCGVSILYNYFKSIGVHADCFLPNRHSDGYGISVDALERLAENYYSDLLISVDCGITSVEEVQYARETLGFDVIVTDHHEAGDTLPDCLIFNPKLSGENCFRDLCGAGVALRIVEGLGGREEMEKYLDIACIATVADVVPLVGDNRIIAHAGLKKINSLQARRGIKMLVKSCADGEITSFDIGFKIAPRINSLGRMGDANGVLDLFCTDDNFLLENIVKELNESNTKRVQLTNDLTEACFEQLKDYDFENNAAIILSNAYWDDGVIGIVASRIADAFNRPTILMTRCGDVYKGSGRSVKGLNIHKYVTECAGLLTKFGGHTMACGLSIKEQDIEKFKEKFNSLIKSDFDMKFFVPSKSYDLDACEVENFYEMGRGLKLLEPCGEGNPRIRFKERIYAKEFKQITTTSHVVCKDEDRELLMFNGLKYREFLAENTPKDCYYSLTLLSFRDKNYAQGKINYFSADSVDGQGDYSSFIMTGLFSGEEQLTSISAEDALLLGEGKYTTCYVAYDIDTYKDFLRRYNDKYGYILTDNRVSSRTVPLTKIFFCPISLKELGYYKNIVLLDKPLQNKIFSRVAGKNAKLYCVGNDGIIKKIRTYLPDYQTLSKIFLAIKFALNERDFSNISDLYYAIAKREKIGYNEFVLAAVVLADLGILKIASKFYIDPSVKTKLAESKIYRLIEG